MVKEKKDIAIQEAPNLKNVVVSLAEIADFLNLTTRRVTGLVDAGILKTVKRGEYRLYECVNAYIRTLQGKTVDPANKALFDEKLREAKSKAELRELQAKKLLGQVLPADQVERAWSEMVMNMRAKLLAIPVKAAPRVHNAKTPAEAQEIIKTFIYEALKELSGVDYGESGDSDDSGASPPARGAASGSDRKRVGRPPSKTKP